MENPSQRARITQAILEHFGIEPEYLWADSPDSAVFRHPGSKKWFGIMMRVTKNRLYLTGDEAVDILNVKCDPILIGSLRCEPGFLPAYHMNKDSWVSILLNGTVPDDRMIPLLDISYDLVAPGVKPHARASRHKSAKNRNT